MAMDPVNKKALKKDFKDRKDQDIDNDGDADSSDQYLHTRRKAISKAIKNVKECFELAESHFEVGDEVECIKSGMEGKVTKIDPEEKGKYYTVKRQDGSVMKYAPDELRAAGDEEMNEEVDLDEKMLTPAEMKKREEIAKAMERENPDMPMDKKMAIATAQAKKVAEQKKPDAVEVMRKKQQMKNISTSDKDKLMKIRDMMRKERK